MAGMNDVLDQVVAVVRTVVVWSNPLTTRVEAYSTQLVPGDMFPAIYVWTSMVNEHRHGLNSSTGKKYVDHTIHIDVKDTTSLPEDPTTGEAGFRTNLDALRDALRSSQVLGGLTIRFGEDIDIEIDQPKLNGERMLYHAVVTSVGREEING